MNRRERGLGRRAGPHRRARRLLGVLWAAPLAISRRASLPKRGPGAASRAVAAPRVAPGPAHAGSQVAPALGAAFRAASARMASRFCLGMDRLRAFGRFSPAAPPRPRSSLSAPPALPPASCAHPSHPAHPSHRSHTLSPRRTDFGADCGSILGTAQGCVCVIA